MTTIREIKVLKCLNHRNLVELKEVVVSAENDDDDGAFSFFFFSDNLPATYLPAVDKTNANLVGSSLLQ